MAISPHELKIRLGKRVRVKIAQPQTPTIPAVELEAILVRIDEQNRIAHFSVGVYVRAVRWDDIEILEGGLGPDRDTSGSSGVAW